MPSKRQILDKWINLRNKIKKDLQIQNNYDKTDIFLIQESHFATKLKDYKKYLDTIDDGIY